jgi:hypothetical protein
MRAAPALTIAAHGVVDIAALYVTTTKASGGGGVRVGATGAKACYALGLPNAVQSNRFREISVVSLFSVKNRQYFGPELFFLCLPAQ